MKTDYGQWLWTMVVDKGIKLSSITQESLLLCVITSGIFHD